MSSIVTLNGTQYVIPAYNDSNWAQGTGNLSQYLVAIASNTLQPTGGAFTLTSELDFGASFGIKALYLKTETATPATTGVIRLASTDALKWRNNANSADISLSKNSSDLLQFNGTNVITAGTGLIVNADVSASAAIAYSKLALTGSILNADLAGSIAYSKLVLTGAILNADLAGSIAVNKLAALTTSRAVATDGSGFLTASPTTVNAAGYVVGTIVQTVTANTTTDTTVTSSTYTVTGLTLSITPKSTTHKIRITVCGSMSSNAANGINMFATIAKNGTNLVGAGGLAMARGSATGLTTFVVPMTMVYIDAPASTSALTYAAYIKNSDNATQIFFPAGDGSGTTGFIIAEEIAA